MYTVSFFRGALGASILALLGCTQRADERAPISPHPGGVAAADRSRGGAMWGANYFPNVSLVTHRGEQVRFFDLIKDKVVAVNFIYTTCSDSCPMETARMREVANLLGERLGSDVFFYSITVDPAKDTPERLNEYATLWHTGPGWTFLTGAEEDITLLRKKFGVYEPDLTKRDHNLSLLIGNQKTGRWMKRSPAENPYVLAIQLGSWLHNWKLPSAGERDYAKAPEVRNISTGEELFRARCSSCHTIGGGDRAELEVRRVGPDLFEVGKRRERAWLVRWIMEPDAMLAEQDPTALQLFAAYKNIVMPNMRLSKADADAVLAYLDEESAFVRSHMPVRAEAAPLPLASSPLSDRALGAVRASLVAYEAMRAAFADDDLPGAKTQVTALAGGFLSAAATAGAPQQALVELAAAAHAVGGAGDIDGARLRFGELSQRVIALLVGEPTLREGRHLFICPMASGYNKWVQMTPALTNPYWGKRMLTCGNEIDDWVR